MSSKRTLLPILLMFGILLIAVGIFYRQPLFAPNQTFMGGGVDGLKNYYTPWYHAKYDSTFTHFQGMNYPYGEHVVFADAQPLLSNAVKLLGLADWTVGIMNYALLISIFVTGWLLFRILRRWQVNEWWAAMSAAAITLLSPQLLKMNGHYALAYTFVVPLIWHLALRAFERPGMVRSLTIAGTIFLLGWLHPYFVMIAAVFLTAFWAAHSLVAWRESTLVQKLAHYAAQVILPVAAFTLALQLSDGVGDRPANPYGLEEYVATWRGIFTPIGIKFLDVIPKGIWKNLDESWEGLAYIGLAGGLLFWGFWIRTCTKVVRLRLRHGSESFHFIPGKETPDATRKLIAASVLAGLAVGLFSCGIPFAIKPEILTELFPPIKQFRSLGRFSWGFYYTWLTFSFFLFWQIFQWLQRVKTKAVGIAFAVVVLGWTFFEGIGLNAGVRIRTWLVKAATYAQGQAGMIPGMHPSPWMSSIQPEKYAAIVALPYFHEGSEGLRANSSLPSKYAFEASIRTGLPMLNVVMSRTSLSQTWAMLQMITEPGVPLEILEAIHDPRPILAMRFGTSKEFDGPYMQRVGGAVYAQDSIQFYALHLRELQDSLLQLHDPVPDTLWDGPPGLKTDRADRSVVWMDFETDGTATGYRSAKGKTVRLKDNNFILDGHLQAQAGETILVSLWLKMRGDRLPLTLLGYEELDGKEGVVWDYLSLHNNIKRLEGDWALCEREFVVQDPAHTIRLNVTTWKRRPPEITFDNVLIRKKGTDVYGYQNGLPVWKNNRYMQFELRADTVATSPSGK